MKVHLRPAPGRRVHDVARGDVLPKEGRTVTLTNWWRRRLRAGDVIEDAKVDPEDVPKKKKTGRRQTSLDQ